MDQVKWNVNFILNETVETIIRGKDVAKSCKGKSFCNNKTLGLRKTIKFSAIL